MQLQESAEVGELLLVQALRSLKANPDEIGEAHWTRFFKGDSAKTREEVLADIGLGTRLAVVVAKKLLAIAEPTSGDERAAPGFDHHPRHRGPGGAVRRLLPPDSRRPDHRADQEGPGPRGAHPRLPRDPPVPLRSGEMGRRAVGPVVRPPVRRERARSPPQNHRGVLARLAAEVSEADSNIDHIETEQRASHAYTTIVFTLEVKQPHAPRARASGGCAAFPRWCASAPEEETERAAAGTVERTRSASRNYMKARSFPRPTRPPPSAPTRRRCAPATPCTSPARSRSTRRPCRSWKASRPGEARVRQPAGGVQGRRAATSTDVVRVTVYLTDLAQLRQGERGDGGLLQRSPIPARAAIGVASLPRGSPWRSTPSCILRRESLRPPPAARDADRGAGLEKLGIRCESCDLVAAPAAALRGRDAAHAR